jgi:hypothetical protein
MALFQRELAVILGAYFLAAIPIGAIMLAGRMSPLYRIPTGHLVCWWSRFALLIVAFAVVISVAGAGAGD